MKTQQDMTARHIDLRRRRLLQASLSMLAPAVSMTATAADAWPSRPIRLIVSYPAGTSADFVGRVFAEPLARALRQPVVVDNKAGATGIIGVDAVAKATDGFTLGVTGNGPLTTAKALNPKLAFDVARDLRPISLLASTPYVLTGSTQVPAGDLTAVLAWARSQGDKLSYGSIGLGSGSHLAMELLKSLTGIKPVHVPFQGFAQVASAMAAGQIDLGFMAPSVAMPLAAGNRLRVLGISTAEPSPMIANVPSIAQVLKLPTFDVSGWNALFGPASMPEAHAVRVSEELARIAQTPETRQRLSEQGWQSIGSTPEGLSRQIATDTALWGEIIRSTGTRSE